MANIATVRSDIYISVSSFSIIFVKRLSGKKCAGSAAKSFKPKTAKTAKAAVSRKGVSLHEAHKDLRHKTHCQNTDEYANTYHINIVGKHNDRQHIIDRKSHIH